MALRPQKGNDRLEEGGSGSFFSDDSSIAAEGSGRIGDFFSDDDDDSVIGVEDVPLGDDDADKSEPPRFAADTQFDREDREEMYRGLYLAIAAAFAILVLFSMLIAISAYLDRPKPMGLLGKFASRAEFESRASRCFRPATEQDAQRWAETRIACDPTAGCVDLSEVRRALAASVANNGIACTTFPKTRGNASWPCACAIAQNETLFFLDPRVDSKARALAPGTFVERIHAFGGERVETRVPEWIDASAAQWPPERGRRTFRFEGARAVLFLRAMFFLDL